MNKIKFLVFMFIFGCNITITDDKMDRYCMDKCIDAYGSNAKDAAWAGNDILLNVTRCECYLNGGLVKVEFFPLAL